MPHPPLADSWQKTDCNGIEYAEQGGITMDSQTKDQSTTRVLYCRWDENVEFQRDMLGSCGECPGPTKVCAPQSDPNRPWLHCVECRLVQGLGQVSGSGGPIEFEDLINGEEGYAQFQCTFRGLEYDVAATGASLTNFIIKRKTYATETLIVHGGAFVWADTLETVAERRGIHQQLIELTYLQVMRPDPLPEALLQQMVNTANAVLFDSRYSAYSLLMLAPEVRRYYDAAGKRCWDMTIKWLMRKRATGGDGDWRKLFRSGSPPAYVEVTPNPFPAEDHTPLFTPCT